MRMCICMFVCASFLVLFNVYASYKFIFYVIKPGGTAKERKSIGMLDE